jgi:hypothetical protein
MEWARGLTNLMLELYASDIDLYNSVRTFVAAIVDNRSVALAPSSPVRASMQVLYQFVDGFVAAQESLVTDLDLGAQFFDRSPESVRPVLETLHLTTSLFRDIAAMNVIRRELCSAGLSPLFRQLDAGDFAKSDVAAVFHHNFHRLWLSEKTRRSENLNNITGLQLTALDAEFKRYDEHYRACSEKALSANIASGKPRLGSLVIPDTPVGLIVRENQKSRGHLPIRKFLDAVQPVARSLKPCYLMSPMSVSQYLPVSADFDLVIFDEASQIPPWDAIGALSRGKQAIIVGDTRQLPPTTFFSMNMEDHADELVDGESVLEMLGGMFPEMLLKWHYRSRSESLINFSNHHV